jgi:hypothetical protein
VTYTHVMETLVRRARKRYDCVGSGGADPKHAEGCPRVIEPGDEYVEYFGEAPAYQSGSRHTLACGMEFLGVGDDGED